MICKFTLRILLTLIISSGLAFADDADFPLVPVSDTTVPTLDQNVAHNCLKTQTGKTVYYYAPTVLEYLPHYYGVSESEYTPLERTILDFWEPLTVSSESIELADSSLFDDPAIDPPVDESLQFFAYREPESDTDFQVWYGTHRITGMHFPNFDWPLYILRDGVSSPPLTLNLFRCALIPEWFEEMPVPGTPDIIFMPGPTVRASGP